MIPAMSFGQVAAIAVIAKWRRSVIALCRSPRPAHKRSIPDALRRLEDSDSFVPSPDSLNGAGPLADGLEPFIGAVISLHAANGARMGAEDE